MPSPFRGAHKKPGRVLVPYRIPVALKKKIDDKALALRMPANELAIIILGDFFATENHAGLIRLPVSGE